MDEDPTPRLVRAEEALAGMQEEIRFELGLLHARVNALVGAEAFLAIAYTSSMGNGTRWGAQFSLLVSPVLSVLGLLLALLAWSGTSATGRIILEWTARSTELLRREPQLAASLRGSAMLGRGGQRAGSDQWRSLLFFRAVPGLFALVWVVLTVVALVLRR